MNELCCNMEELCRTAPNQTKPAGRMIIWATRYGYIGNYKQGRNYI